MDIRRKFGTYTVKSRSSRLFRQLGTYNRTNPELKARTIHSRIMNLRAQISSRNNSNSLDTSASSGITDRYNQFIQANSNFLDNIPLPEDTVEAHLYDKNDLPEYEPGSKRTRKSRKEFAKQQFNQGIYDIDGNGVIESDTDGKLIYDFLKAKSEDQIAKHIGSNNKYDIDQVMDRLEQLRSHGVLDIDNDGKTDRHDGYKTHYWIKRFD